jgi:hypothetical protein
MLYSKLKQANGRQIVKHVFEWNHLENRSKRTNDCRVPFEERKSAIAQLFNDQGVRTLTE